MFNLFLFEFLKECLIQVGRTVSSLDVLIGPESADILDLTIFNKGTYLTFKSIFHKALNLF